MSGPNGEQWVGHLWLGWRKSPRYRVYGIWKGEGYLHYVLEETTALNLNGPLRLQETSGPQQLEVILTQRDQMVQEGWTIQEGWFPLEASTVTRLIYAKQDQTS